MKHFVSTAEVRRYCALGKAENVAIEIIERDREIEQLRNIVIAAQKDFNWMYNEGKFLDPSAMKYLLEYFDD